MYCTGKMELPFLHMGQKNGQSGNERVRKQANSLFRGKSAHGQSCSVRNNPWTHKRALWSAVVVQAEPVNLSVNCDWCLQEEQFPRFLSFSPTTCVFELLSSLSVFTVMFSAAANDHVPSLINLPIIYLFTWLIVRTVNFPKTKAMSLNCSFCTTNTSKSPNIPLHVLFLLEEGCKMEPGNIHVREAENNWVLAFLLHFFPV